MKKIIVVFLLICSVFAAAGCQNEDTIKNDAKSGEIKIGYIDSDAVMRGWDKYKNIGDKYIAEREALVKELSKDKKATFEDRVRLEEFDRKWNEQRFAVLDEIRSAGKEIASENNLAILLDNAGTRPTIEYGGENYTTQVLEKLRMQK